MCHRGRGKPLILREIRCKLINSLKPCVSYLVLCLIKIIKLSPKIRVTNWHLFFKILNSYKVFPYGSYTACTSIHDYKKPFKNFDLENLKFVFCQLKVFFLHCMISFTYKHLLNYIFAITFPLAFWELRDKLITQSRPGRKADPCPHFGNTFSGVGS